MKYQQAIKTPEFILFAQHGWADTDKAIAKLAQALTTPKSLIVTPNLGFLKTWLRIDALIDSVEKSFIDTRNHYPNTPIRIIGHSMGGLIWLEVLARHPEWWTTIESLVLIASPVGGADLARIFDPLELGIGIARDLGKNRQPLAQKIAEVIPTLAIAGNVDNGSDGTITVKSTKFSGSQFICLPGISHAALRNHPSVGKFVADFWSNPNSLFSLEPNLTSLLVKHLKSVPGITDAHRRDFYRSQVYLTFKNGLNIRTWKNPLGVDHVFVADHEGECLYSGFVGWMHTKALYQVLEHIQNQYFCTK